MYYVGHLTGMFDYGHGFKMTAEISCNVSADRHSGTIFAKSANTATQLIYEQQGSCLIV